ncbi:MAG: hypothetical protein OXG24_02560 [Gammaproteobacteria bacterium]|nr:hypothetical protein [Gammaproteobacteria bacterium]
MADIESQPEPLTAQQRYDLIYALFQMRFVVHDPEIAEVWDSKLQSTTRKLLEEYPHDVSINVLAVASEFRRSDDESFLETARYLVHLAPYCNSNTFLLSSHLERLITRNEDRSAEEIAVLVDERNKLLELGYQHAKTKGDKVEWGGKRYMEYLRIDEAELARQWRNMVVREINPPGLLVDSDNVEDSLRLICIPRAHRLRLAEHCLRTLERAIEHANSNNEEVSYFVLIFAEELMYGFSLFPFEWRMEPISPERGVPSPLAITWEFETYTPNDAAYIVPRLRDVLELIPEEQQDERFFEVYSLVIGERTRDRWLKKFEERNDGDS